MDKKKTTAWGWGTGKIQVSKPRLIPSLTMNAGFTLPTGVKPHYVVSGRFRGPTAAQDDLMAVTSGTQCTLAMGLNRGEDALGVHLGWNFSQTLEGTLDAAIFQTHLIDTFAVKANALVSVESGTITGATGCDVDTILVPGDYDGDQWADLLLFNVGNYDKEGTIATCLLYKNKGISGMTGDMPSFSKIDCTATFNTTVFIHSRTPVMQAIDWDHDGKDDIIAGTSSGQTNSVLVFYAREDAMGFDEPDTLIETVGLGVPIASASQTAGTGSQCPPSVSRGISTVVTADVEADGDLDLLIGSESETAIYVWTNDGGGVFTAAAPIPFVYGAATFIFAGDMDGDGRDDLAVARRSNENGGFNNTCKSSGSGTTGLLSLFLNDPRSGFVLQSASVNGRIADDVDWMIIGNLDSDAMADMMIGASAGGTGNTALSFSAELKLKNIFSPTGVAVSTSVDTVNAASGLIAAVKVSSLDLVKMDPLDTYKLYVSNDNGAHWRQVVYDELPPTSQEVVFTTFGSDLRWKIELKAGRTTTSNGRSVATSWPALRGITLDYRIASQGEYSRSELTTGRIDVGAPDERELLFSASFMFPSFYGKLRALDITKLGKSKVASAQLERIDTLEDVSLFWEAGEKLRAVSGENRWLFTAFPATAGGQPINKRVNIDANALNASKKTYPNLQAAMGVSNNTKLKVLQFIRTGMGSPDGSKLYDPGHASPVFVGTATGDATYLGDGYEAFTTQTKQRRAMVYLGANDGILHAFDAKTGNEQWGFVPNNLLGKLRLQWREVKGKDTYTHMNLVDGPVVVRDVYDAKVGQWRTLVLGGQGAGQGLGDNNYYYAVDVTNPDDPKPLWEFTDPFNPPVQVCHEPTTTASSECGGAEANMKCCTQTQDGLSQGEYFCAPVKSTCVNEGPVMGQTKSPPAIGRIRVSGQSKWVVMFGSGYDNRNAVNVGRTIYMVDAMAGTMLGSWTLTEVPWFSTGNPSDIINTVPAGVSIVDVDDDGFVDRVYVGDLEGRIWKLDTSQEVSMGTHGQLSTASKWPFCPIFDAGANGTSGRRWAPIVTKPAVSVIGPGTVNVYFGTGGDDRAPSNIAYRFYGIRDDDASGTCRSTPDNESNLDANLLEWVVAEPTIEVGQRFWADPVIVANRTIYFASVAGQIEVVSPCLASSNQSYLYAYAIKNFKNSSGQSFTAGKPVLSQSAFLATGGVLRGVLQRGTSPDAWTRPKGFGSANVSDIFVQELSATTTGAPAVKRIADDGIMTGGGRIRVMQWREIPL